MRGQNQRLHQEGMGSRTASHAVHTPPIHPLFSLFSCPYKNFPTESFIAHMADSSALCGCTALRMILLNLIIGGNTHHPHETVLGTP